MMGLVVIMLMVFQMCGELVLLGVGLQGMCGRGWRVMEDVCEDGMQNLGGKLALMFMRAHVWLGGSSGGGSDIFF